MMIKVEIQKLCLSISGDRVEWQKSFNASQFLVPLPMSSLLHHNVKLDPPLAIFNMDNPPASFKGKKEPPSQNVDKSPEDNSFYWEEAGMVTTCIVFYFATFLD